MKLPDFLKFDKKSIFVLAVSLLAMLLGVGSYDLTFHYDERNEEIAQDATGSEPLSVFDFEQLDNKKTCTYTFIVSGETTIQKSLDFERKKGRQCGCLYDLEIPYYVRPQKVVVKNYRNKQDILDAIPDPEGFQITNWNYDRIWFVSKENCKETLPK